MVKHIVFWKLKETTEVGTREENAAIIKAKLEALVGVVPGLLSAQVGSNVNPAGWDLCLCSDFVSHEALAGYQEHPAHLEAKALVHAAITDRAVVDYDYEG